MLDSRTFSNDTRSAACNSVNPEMSSTILFNLGSAVVGGGGGVVEAVSAAAVAKHLEGPARAYVL